MSSNKLMSLLKGVKKPSENQAVIDEVKQLVRRYCIIPTPTNAMITSSHDGEYRFRVDYSHPDLDNLEKFCYTKYYSAKLGPSGLSSVVRGCDEPIDTSAELASTVSRDGQMKAVIRKVSGDGGKDKELVEICDRRSRIKSINGVKEKIHGKIHLFANFSVLRWSQDNRYLIYVAEKYRETCGYFASKGKEEEGVKGQGDEFLYREEFGEQMEGLSHSCICIIDTKNEYKIRVIEKENYSLSEGFFFDKSTIGFIGIKETPFRLGLIFCPIRESCLFKLDLDNPESEPVAIYGENLGLSLRSPRPNSKGQVVLLQNPARGPHFQASDLVLYDMTSEKSRTLHKSSNEIPKDLHNPERIEDLFALSLPRNVWSKDERKIVLTAEIGVRSHVFVLDVESGSMKRIHLNGEVNSILDLFEDILIVNELSPISGPRLRVGLLTESCSAESFVLMDPEMYNQHDEMFYEYEIIPAPVLDKESEKHKLTTILLGRKEDFGKPTPTIVRPHGGPHGSNLATYFPSLLVYAELGFKLLFVNYRGSYGMNSKQLEYLCGKVGRSDVADVAHGIKHYIDAGEIDDQRISLVGGSHGGFLVTHLIGQCGDDFQFNSCVALNPVIDISAMISVTDIPDWTLVEGLGNVSLGFPFENIQDSKVLAKLKECSPIMHIDRVKTPTLVVLGTRDQRVPMSQGRVYYQSLKCRSIPAKCLVYEDNHNVTKIPNSIDLTMNSIMWILDHLPRSDQ